MSHLPWMAQETLGIARDSGSSSSTAGRVANPTASTPATFGENLNWDRAENGPTDPTPEEGICTFMGPSTSFLSGTGRKWPGDKVHLIKAALDIMRKHGHRCQLPPEGWVDEDEDDDDEVKGGGRSKNSKEIAYLEDKYYEEVMVLGKQTDEVVFMMKSSCGWLQIRCAGKEAEDFVEEHLADSEHYLLSKVTHDETSSTDDDGLPEGISITRRTGGEAQSSEVGARRRLSPSSVGTLFELNKGNKVIAKALCSYRNCEMDNPGPTIELFEVAKEWRRHGYGKLLLHQGVSSFFEDTFSNIVCSDEVVKFNVCYCTNRHACEWFLRQGFQDWDGMGEELGRYLGSVW